MTDPNHWREIFRPVGLAFRRWRQPEGRLVKLNGLPLRLDPGVSLPRQSEIEYEPDYFRAFLAAINPGDVVLDVGANQGLHTILAAKKVGPNGRVFSFEPAPPAIDILQRMIQINGVDGQVRIVSALVGDTHGATLPFHVAPTAVGWASAAYQPPGTRELLVPSVKLDDFTIEMDLAPVAIKIDVEGFEHRVLAGARELLRLHRPHVFCALHPEILEKNGTTGGAIIEEMRSLGYAAATPNGMPVDPDRDTEIIFAPE